MAEKKNNKKIWFSSTMFVLVIAFIISVALGVWRYGWNIVLDEILKYCVGATATALFIAIIGLIFRKQIKSLIKKI